MTSPATVYCSLFKKAGSDFDTIRSELTLYEIYLIRYYFSHIARPWPWKKLAAPEIIPPPPPPSSTFVYSSAFFLCSNDVNDTFHPYLAITSNDLSMNTRFVKYSDSPSFVISFVWRNIILMSFRSTLLLQQKIVFVPCIYGYCNTLGKIHWLPFTMLSWDILDQITMYTPGRPKLTLKKSPSFERNYTKFACRCIDSSELDATTFLI